MVEGLFGVENTELMKIHVLRKNQNYIVLAGKFIWRQKAGVRRQEV